jgi:hypothetical protein
MSHLSHWLGGEELEIAEKDARDMFAPTAAGDDLALIQSTSGTRLDLLPSSLQDQ